MHKIITLTQLGPGQTATVKSLLAIGTIRRRLQDIGIVSGTKIKCVQKSPLGDPTAYFIRGAVIAIRQEDAMNIILDINGALPKNKEII